MELVGLPACSGAGGVLVLWSGSAFLRFLEPGPTDTFQVRTETGFVS